MEVVAGTGGFMGVVAAEVVGARMLRFGPGVVAWNVGRSRAETRDEGGGAPREMAGEPSGQKAGMKLKEGGN